MCRTNISALGSKEDIEELHTWVQKGKAWAMDMLAHRYMDGVGVKQSDKKAVELYEMAAKRGNATAQNDLGVFYEHGRRGVTQSNRRAIEYYTLAANQGHPTAQFNLGCIYTNGGEGIEQSYSKAREWFTKAAAQGEKSAIKALKRLDEAGV